VRISSAPPNLRLFAKFCSVVNRQFIQGSKFKKDYSVEIKLAGCIILDDTGKVLLLHRYTDGSDHWEIPGGKLKAGETEEQAAVRELQEELGVHVLISRKLGTQTFNHNERSMRYTWFLGTTRGLPTIQEPETFDYLNYFSREDMKRLALSSGAACFVSLLDKGTITL
jgi:8-oxo-dGTP diphosphatase